jgi:hypothetical protein
VRPLQTKKMFLWYRLVRESCLDLGGPRALTPAQVEFPFGDSTVEAKVIYPKNGRYK